MFSTPATISSAPLPLFFISDFFGILFGRFSLIKLSQKSICLFLYKKVSFIFIFIIRQHKQFVNLVVLEIITALVGCKRCGRTKPKNTAKKAPLHKKLFYFFIIAPSTSITANILRVLVSVSYFLNWSRDRTFFDIFVI